jgi:hypothetical protein
MSYTKRILGILTLALITLFQIERISAQKLVLSPSFGAGFSGLGDILGIHSDIGLTKYTKSKFFIKIAVGISQASQKVFSDEELKNLNNLLVADRWIENYPYLIFKEVFFQGKYPLSPKSNFQNNLFLRLTLGKKFSIANFMDIHLSAGMGINKFDNTYVTALQLPSTITNNYGTINGIITINLIDSGILIPFIADADLTFKLTNTSRLGLYAGLSEGFIRYTSAGLRMHTVLK